MQFGVLSNVPLETRLDTYLPRFIELEHASYPPTEAASERSLELRVRRCAEWFVFMKDPAGVIMGFACGTLGLTDKIASPEAMTTHQENGSYLFMHSVVVEQSLRGKGHGLALVKEFVKAARSTPQVQSISLIAKSKGIALYSRAGFSFMGDSALRHGNERWYAMELLLKTNRVVCVDAFSAVPFKGNSAAVVILPDRPFTKVESKEKKQEKKVRVDSSDNDQYLGLTAREFNVAETAFVQFQELGGTGFASTLHPLNKILAVAQSSSLTEIPFNETLATIKAHFQFRTDVKFRVGETISEKGQNVGSLCVLGFAKACGLDAHATVRLWCEHHTNVLEHPNETSHPNIRSFLSGGKVMFQFAEDGSEVTTPIENFDVHGLSLLASRQSPILTGVPGVFSAAIKVINDNIQFSKVLSDERVFEAFQNLFFVDEDHTTAARKLQNVKSVSHSLLEILARYNIVDIPAEFLRTSLVGISLAQFCQDHKLDDQARKRLGLAAPSARSIGFSASASLRWFTPAQMEVDLCGHATLAAAHALFFEIGPLAGRSDFSSVKFATRSGELIASKGVDGKSIELDFPLQTVEEIPMNEQYQGLISSAFPSLNISNVEFIGRTSTNDTLLVISTSAFREHLKIIDLAAIKKFEGRGVSVTCLNDQTGEDADFLSRFFAPQVGIDEDPVTGSAHCFLAPFWAKRLGKASLVGVQLSAREGRVDCEVKSERVVLRGFSAVAWRGEVVKV